jgi:uncharacterized protein YbaP (TraB family)
MRIPLRTHRLALVFCALISISALAQTSPYKPGAPLLMWKVSSKTNSAYVLGSVHLADKSLYPLPSVIENAFAAASVLIVEADMNKADKTQLQQLMMTLGTYPPNDDLFHHITPATRAKLSDFLGGYGIPPEAFAKFRPWMVSLMVVMLPMAKSGMNPNDGIDMYFLNKAGNKRVEQLEDAAWQIKLYAEFPESASDKSLSRTLTQAKDASETMTNFETYWTQGAVGKTESLMASLSADESKEEKAFERRLREDRNPHMADRLEKCLQSSSESCFMVVGAAHVIGNEGIVKLMQARGYKTEQAVVSGTK